MWTRPGSQSLREHRPRPQLLGGAIAKHARPVDACGLARLRTKYIQHQLRVVVELQAVPVPASRVGDDEVAPLVIHPGDPVDGGVLAITCRDVAADAYACPRVVIRA